MQTATRTQDQATTDLDSERNRQTYARVILDEMYQFLGLLDTDGNVLEINRAALEGAGITLSDVVGRPFWEARWWAVSEDGRDRVREMVRQARSGSFVRCDIEVYGAKRGQETIVVDFSLTPIRNEKGEVAFLLPEGRNITEKIAIEAELNARNAELGAALDKLREIDGFKTRFFANVSHDLRTPLALILGPVDQLLSNADGLSPRQRSWLSTVSRNARSLLQRVNDLLDLARFDSLQSSLNYSSTNIRDLAGEVLETFSAAAEHRNVSLTLDGPEHLFADVDRAKLSRILTNLLSNAFKFTPIGGLIACTIRRIDSHRFSLSVRDTGPGVPADYRDAIFGRYSQGPDDSGGAGSGLGLNIVKEFVELHLGTVAVLDAPGGGAIFHVELPIDAPRGAYVESLDGNARSLQSIRNLGAEPAAASQVDQGNTRKPRILVVEDNPDLRQFLFDVLSSDYDVTLAENGAKALMAALRSPPHLVITDLMMPYFDGERFIRELRAPPQYPTIPVLVLSARSDDVLRQTLLDGLVQDYVTKPFSPQELRARIRNLVSVKLTVDVLQRELNSQASDIGQLTEELIENRNSLHRSLQALQASERRWLSLYDNTAVGIALADKTGRIIDANPALQRMLGYGNGEIAGIPILSETDFPLANGTVENGVDSPRSPSSQFNTQRRYETKTGAQFWANVSASTIPPTDGNDARLAVIVEDITSRKQAERDLAAIQVELARVSRFTTMGELVATIAHEVNQPLSAIVTNSQAALRWIQREDPNFPEVISALRRVNRDAAAAAEVITRTRSFLKTGVIKREPTTASEIIRGPLSMLRTTLQELSVRLDITISQRLPKLMIDRVQIQQVLLNLVMNAIDAMRDLNASDRRLTIGVTPYASGGAMFSVGDTGRGIPQEDEQNIFSAFYTTKPDGLGMGLAICRSIVESHGGRLWLERLSTPGARFVFTLPPVGPEN